MKVLLATYWYLPHIGGVNTYLQVLKKGLEKRGHQVDILAHHPRMSDVYLLERDWRIAKKPILYPIYDKMMDYYNQYLPDLDDWARFRDIERYVFELASLLLGLQDYDLIHTHDVISTRALSRVKPKHIPHVATIHGLLMEEFFVTKEIETEGSMRWKFSYVEEYYGASSSDLTILPSEWLRREYLNRFHVPQEKLTVIPYGLNVEHITSQADTIERIPRTDNRVVMICPARLVPYKGQRYLIEALAEILKMRRDFICQFAGDGVEKNELQVLAQTLNLQDHVEFLGNRKDIYYLLKQADLFVLPSLVENHSLAVMEAQVIGLPVIATRTGGTSELINHLQTGILVEPRNSEELYKAILGVMDDPDLRNNLSANGKRWARKYWHPDHMVERILEIYHRLIEQAK